MNATLVSSPPGSPALSLEADLSRFMLRVIAGSGSLPDPLEAALEHHFRKPGSVSRGRLAWDAGSRLGLKPGDALALAAAVELLHNASLVQDDLQDESPERRGQEAVWRRFGQDTALAVVDLLLGGGYGALAEVSHPERIPALLRQVQEAVRRTVIGQVADRSGTHAGGALLDEGLACTGNKAGPLFALSLELPLLLAGFDADLPSAHRAALSFGTGYQIVDDLADLEDDRVQGAFNLVLALEDAGAEQPARRAGRLARRHLGLAAELARPLPRNCGALLVDFVEHLLERLARMPRE